MPAKNNDKPVKQKKPRDRRSPGEKLWDRYLRMSEKQRINLVSGKERTYELFLRVITHEESDDVKVAALLNTHYRKKRCDCYPTRQEMMSRMILGEIDCHDATWEYSQSLRDRTQLRPCPRVLATYSKYHSSRVVEAAIKGDFVCLNKEHIHFAMNHSSSDVRIAAVSHHLTAAFLNEEDMHFMMVCKSDPCDEVRLAAVTAKSVTHENQRLSDWALMIGVKDKSWKVRLGAVYACAMLPPVDDPHGTIFPKFFPRPLMVALNDENEGIRRAAAMMLNKGELDSEQMHSFMNHADPVVREIAQMHPQNPETNIVDAIKIGNEVREMKEMYARDVGDPDSEHYHKHWRSGTWSDDCDHYELVSPKWEYYKLHDFNGGPGKWFDQDDVVYRIAPNTALAHFSEKVLKNTQKGT